MAGEVSIPDEAWQAGAIEAEATASCYEISTVVAERVAERAVDAAAPYIDRAARIDVLQRYIELCERGELNPRGIAYEMQRELDELEADRG